MTGMIANFLLVSFIQWTPLEAMDRGIWNQSKQRIPSRESHNDDHALLLLLHEASKIGQA